MFSTPGHTERISQVAASWAEKETNTKIVKTVVYGVATWGWLQKASQSPQTSMLNVNIRVLTSLLQPGKGNAPFPIPKYNYLLWGIGWMLILKILNNELSVCVLQYFV